MPWKLIAFLIVLALVVAFVGLNVQYTSNISFGFYTLEDVPIFISLFTAFFVGVLVTLPFTFGRRSRKSRDKPKQKIEKSEKRGRKQAGGDQGQREQGPAEAGQQTAQQR
jgi:uncharacterized integral membrane protein